MYKVIAHFKDLQDNNYEYNPGDTFPRTGYEASKERIDELSTDKNRRHKPVIEVVNSKHYPQEPKKTEEPEEEFMNPPETIEEAPKEAPKRRGRKKKDADK